MLIYAPSHFVADTEDLMKTCPICKKRFRNRKNPQVKFCSYACRGESTKKRKLCWSCGIAFIPHRRKQMTCSRPCGMHYKLSRWDYDPMSPVRRRLASFCCGLISRCLRNKTGRTAHLLGYSSETLRKHLEAHFQPGMSWGNYGNTKDSWSIDHTRPISSFPHDTPLREINALANLRPMWHSHNSSKKNK